MMGEGEGEEGGREGEYLGALIHLTFCTILS